VSSISDGATYYYSVRGIRTGGTGPAFYTSVSKLALLSVYASSSTSAGLLNYVSVSWSYVSSAAEYYVERSTNGGSWAYLTTTTSTSYYDYNVAPVDDYHQYRVTARAVSGVSNSAADSTPRTSSIAYAPSVYIEYRDWSTQYSGTISAGQYTYYRFPNPGVGYANFYLSDTDNRYFGGETVDAWFTVISANSGTTVLNVDNSSGAFYSFSSSEDLILAVRGYSSSSSGNFNFMLQY
jgi:hypothetical protein